MNQLLANMFEEFEFNFEKDLLSLKKDLILFDEKIDKINSILSI